MMPGGGVIVSEHAKQLREAARALMNSAEGYDRNVKEVVRAVAVMRGAAAVLEAQAEQAASGKGSDEVVDFTLNIDSNGRTPEKTRDAVADALCDANLGGFALAFARSGQGAGKESEPSEVPAETPTSATPVGREPGGSGGSLSSPEPTAESERVLSAALAHLECACDCGRDEAEPARAALAALVAERDAARVERDAALDDFDVMQAQLEAAREASEKADMFLADAVEAACAGNDEDWLIAEGDPHNAWVRILAARAALAAVGAPPEETP